MEKDKKVTALYCRLSKDDGSNSESLSIRTQKAMLMEYATRNGFGNCQYYVDDGYSGTNSDRPAFQELLDDIRDGKVATVITKDQSRLGRNHIETGTYMEIFFPEHGVRYIAINDGYDSNEQSQMDIAPFRNIINEMYAKDTSRKIKSALRTRKKSGKYISSGAPFGYQKDPADHNHLVIDPNTAPVVEYAKLYEDVSKGLLPEKRFQMLADRYDKEQAELTEKIEQYEREGRAEHDQLDKIQDFIDEVSKYAGITELNYKILHQLIDKILVSKAEKVDGEYVQKIQIFYRFIGPLDAIE